jgi:hypothetical protein
LSGAVVLATAAVTTAYRRHDGQSTGAALDDVALARRRRVVDAVDPDGRIGRRLRRHARAHHHLYAALPSAVAASRRGAALGAGVRAAASRPGFLATEMWWRAGAHALVRTRRVT